MDGRRGDKGLAKEQILLRMTRDRKLWRRMIAHVLKGHDTWKKKSML